MTILTLAQDAVDGDRNDKYGHPGENHGCTAKMVSAYLSKRYDMTVKFDAFDVCAFNILQKVSRLAHTPDHRDSLVDIAGYARNWEILYGPE